MKNIFYSVIVLSMSLIVFSVQASDSTGIRMNTSTERINDSEVIVSGKVFLPKGMKLYMLQTKSNQLLYSGVSFDSSVSKLLVGKTLTKGKITSEKDPSLNAAVQYVKDSVTWQQKIRAAIGDSIHVKGDFNYLCSVGDTYIPGQKKFNIPIDRDETKSLVGTTNDYAKKSLGWIALIGFLSGLGALLTPCVFSMLPVTVSFFTKRSKTKAEGKRNALLYSVSIVCIFTVIGFLITFFWGAAALNNLATNWVANLFFFALFTIFGISFLGGFEISLPSAWSTRSDKKANTNNFFGIFFMALTLVLVSFSCTGPFIGNLLPIIGKGGYFGPLAGFASFSLALALPFSLFAFFPGLMNSVAKPGAWLNMVKVTMGFVELALALKFFSNADLAKGWRLLDREIFICLWVAISVLLGLYYLGKLILHHDDELPKNDFGQSYLSVKRVLFSVVCFAFALYMLPGLWGAPLKSISAFVPPMGTQDFSYTSSLESSSATTKSVSSDRKYSAEMKMYEPDVVRKSGLETYYDYEEALRAARSAQKPLMLDFTGINCINCRKMEGQVWSDPAVMTKLKNEFIVVSLYVDVHHLELPAAQQHFSEVLKKNIETIGDRNAEMQVKKFGANTQPYYFFLDAKENKLLPEGYGYDPDVNRFSSVLDAVLLNYKKHSTYD